MDQIENPSEALWNERRDWFEDLFDIEKRGGSYMVGEHATGLLVDLQATYCAGAFIACVILGCTIIDSHIRETETGPDFRGGIESAFGFSSFRTELDWLRKRRNRLVHFKKTSELAISVDDHFSNRDSHEVDAKRTITLVASVFFENPWV